MLLTTPQETRSIASIVSRARSLPERLSLGLTPSAIDENQVEARLKTWCQIVALGDLNKFKQRLAWAGLDIEQIRPFLADNNEDRSLILPLWANTLERVINKAQTISHEQRVAPQRYLDSKEPIPFEHIYLPCIQVAQAKLLDRLGDRINLFTDVAQAKLERQLLAQLSDVCTETLSEEFSAFRSSGSTTRDFLLFNIINCQSQDKYHGFINKLFADGLLSLFQKYSVLGKLVATTIDLWIDSIAEFIDRLATNWSAIEESFSPQQSLRQVTEIKPGLSDPHNGGRSVIILTFDTGMKLVYKPKDLSIEAAFYQFLDWCNSQEQLLSFQVLQVLNYSTHGWVEYVESLPCQNEAEAQRFYQRSGMLLCLIHILEGTDCHWENLIASGEQPILIDTETLFHHRQKMPDSNGTPKAQILVNKKILESPLRTLMLPQWGLLPSDDLNIDLSGLGGIKDQVVPTIQWKNINTDGMKTVPEIVTLQEASAPTINETSLTPDKYLTELVAGFEQMYGFLSKHQELLLAPESPLTIFADLTVRYLFRTTRTYGSILNSSFSPSLLQSGIDRSIGLDVLSRAFLQSAEKPAFWSILDAELQAMEQLDIPFLTIKTTQKSMELSTGVVISELSAESSFERVILRLKSLNQDDLNQQLEIIHGSFCARFAQEPDFITSQTEDPISVLPECPSLTSEQLVQESIALAQDLKKRAICATDGSVTWIGLQRRANCPGFQLQGLSNNLYDGSPGIALFLAALAKVTGNSDWRDLALGTLKPLRYNLHNLSHEQVKAFNRMGIGGATGLGSMVYALVQISHFLQDSDLREDAQKIATLITPELISADRNFDIMDGAAGTILGCLKLHQVETTNSSTVSTSLAQAIACGEHLLKHQINMGDNLNTGFAHGAAGIAYALLRLFALTQDARFLEGATKAIDYEQNYFSTTTQNWQDTRSEELLFRNHWTHGAAGIGLGRLGGLSILDNATIRQDITAAIETTQRFCREDIDNLAWGNLGRIETLLVASQKLQRPELEDFAVQATTYLVKQAQSRGRFNLVSASVPVAYNPGFFQGNTGIGYQLLRIAYPDLVPSVLLWD